MENFWATFLYENIVMAMLMDQGVKLEAKVSQTKKTIDEEKYLDKAFAIEVYAKLLVPFQHLQTNALASKRADDAEDIYRKGEDLNEKKIFLKTILIILFISISLSKNIQIYFQINY